MKYKDCRIVYSPTDTVPLSPRAGQVLVVGQFKDDPNPYEDFLMQIDGEEQLSLLATWYRLLREFHSMTYMCGISPEVAHDALLRVDEYREFIES